MRIKVIFVEIVGLKKKGERKKERLCDQHTQAHDSGGLPPAKLDSGGALCSPNCGGSPAGWHLC